MDAALTDIVAGRFDSAGSTENTIPMWVAAEAGNDLMITGRWLHKSPFVPVPRRSGTEAHSRIEATGDDVGQRAVDGDLEVDRRI